MTYKIIPRNQADNEIRIWSEISGHKIILPLTYVYRDQDSNLACLDHKSMQWGKPVQQDANRWPFL